MAGVDVNSILFDVPLTPPSANHYKVPTSRFTSDGRRIHKISDEAKAWFDALAIMAKGRELTGKTFCVEFCVYRAKGEKGDLDNYAKLILDGLVKARVLPVSDDAVVEMHTYKARDPQNPRTQIQVTRLS